MKRGIFIGGWNSPIYNAIKAYAGSGAIPFHMPGHKLGQGIPPELLDNIAALDLTEIPGMDNLRHPSGIIKEAQELAAAAFGAVRSYFIVNGSTCGIHAVIMSVCRPGDSLIVSRDCHKSVIGGMMLAGVNPVYILPEFDSDFGIHLGVLPDKVEEALDANPGAIGVLLTRPNYYGICSDIERIAQIVHSHGKILIVDEAHGSHLRFNKRLPICAMDAGADICVQSAHKTLPAFTQSAYLHIGSAAVDTDRLEFNLDILQTSSPSYILMAFLDLAREIMQREGSERLDILLDEICFYKASFNPGNIIFLDDRKFDEFVTDSTRITVNVRNLGITGYETEKALRRLENIQIEMSDFFNIVCIATVSDSRDNLKRLFSCLHGLDERFSGNNRLNGPVYTGIKIPVQKLCLKDAMQRKRCNVGLSRAAGMISGGIVAPYPPGIPVLFPGEVIFPETVELLLDIISSGGIVDGLDKNLEIKVIE